MKLCEFCFKEKEELVEFVIFLSTKFLICKECEKEFDNE